MTLHAVWLIEVAATDYGECDTPLCFRETEQDAEALVRTLELEQVEFRRMVAEWTTANPAPKRALYHSSYQESNAHFKATKTWQELRRDALSQYADLLTDGQIRSQWQHTHFEEEERCYNISMVLADPSVTR